MIVTKFGGTSMANAAQIKKACDIQLADPNRKFMVVSAPGKRFDADTKVTDLLIALANAALAGADVKKPLEKVASRYAEIAADFKLDKSVAEEIENDLQARVKKTSLGEARFMDLMKAAGEDNCAKLVAAYLQSRGAQASYVCPKDAGMILTDEAGNARVMPQSYRKLAEHLSAVNGIGVFPGYFGSTENGNIVTFARGGSDITGAILATALQADVYENFTDVDGVFAAHPKLVQNPVVVDSITYREMRELAYAGFNVLHEESVEPVFRARIPINIKNCNNPSALGTRIVNERDAEKFPVVGIAGTKDFCIVNVWKFLMNREIGFGRKLFQMLEEEGISFDHAPSGIDNISPIVSQRQLTEQNEQRLEDRIKNELEADGVSFTRNTALIMIVGEKMFSLRGAVARAVEALSANGISISVISMSGSSVSVTIGVANEDLDTATQVLYREFFAQS